MSNQNGWVNVKDGLPESRKGWETSKDVILLLNRNGEYINTMGCYSYKHNKWLEYAYQGDLNEFIIAWQHFPSHNILHTKYF